MLQNKTQVETVSFQLYFKVIITQNDVLTSVGLNILSDDDLEIQSKIYSFNPVADYPIG